MVSSWVSRACRSSSVGVSVFMCCSAIFLYSSRSVCSSSLISFSSVSFMALTFVDCAG